MKMADGPLPQLIMTLPLLLLLLPPTSHGNLLHPSIIVMDSNFKWNMDVHPTWTSVFTGTNDINPHFPVIAAQLTSFDSDNLELVTVIGGGAYLRLLEDTTFAKIHFFDANINELTKLRALHDFIVRHTYEQWVEEKGAISVDRSFHQYPEEMYLPKALHQAGVRFRTASDFVWPVPSIHYMDAGGRLDALWTLLNPQSYPEFAWNPKTKQGYDNVRAMLTDPNVVAAEFHLALPCSVTSPHRIAVVYVNGAPIPAAAIHAVSSSALAIGIHSMVDPEHVSGDSSERSWGGSATSIIGSPWWHDAHGWWELVVRQEMLLHDLVHERSSVSDLPVTTSLHLWSLEDLEHQGSMYDWFFTAAMGAENYVAGATIDQNDGGVNHSSNAATTAVHAQSITVHMLLGKVKFKKECAARRIQLMNVLKTAINRKTTEQILITEHLKGSNKEAFADANEYPCVVSLQELSSIVQSALQHTTFEIQKIRYIPGEGNPQRNVLFVLVRNDGGGGGRGGAGNNAMEEGVPLLAPVSRSSPSGKISIVIDEQEHSIYVPLEGNVQTFRALAAAFLTKHNVLNIGALNEVVNQALKLQLQRNSVLEQASMRAAVMSQSQQDPRTLWSQEHHDRHQRIKNTIQTYM